MQPSMTDYIPLKKGQLPIYATESASGTGILQIEVLSAVNKGSETTAKCRRMIRRND